MAPLLAELRRDFLALHRDAESIELLEYEFADQRALGSLKSKALAIAARASAALEAATSLYDRVSSECASLESSGESSEQVRSASHIADLAAIARMALKSRVASVDSAPESISEVLASVGGVLRAVQKSLATVDLAIARREHLDEVSDYSHAELARSLAVRREYARLRRDLLRQPAPHADTIESRLRTAGNLIARLTGSSAYQHVRAKDRALLRDLQLRLQAYLRRSRSDGAALAVEGMRLWQDVEILSRLFSGIDRREELVRSDSTCVSRVLESLEPLSADTPVSHAVFLSLEALVGRDEEIDAMIRAKSCAVGALRARLAYVAALIEQATPLWRGSALPAAGFGAEAAERLDEDFF